MAGQLLTDIEIVDAIKANQLSVSGLDTSKLNLGDKSCPIQPSSLDLHVGEIYVPPPVKFDLSKLRRNQPRARRGTPVAPGHSAILVTKERIRLGDNISAFGFPPAHLTSSALLMTNPGHVDPGYEGNLSFTVINLGREDIQIDVDTIIVTLLIFKFENNVGHGYAQLRSSRPTNGTPANESMAEKLNALSPDFGNYSSRMASAALRAVEVHSVRLGWAQLIVPAIAGAVTAALIWLSSLFPNVSAVASDKEVQSEITSAKAELSAITDGLDERVSDINLRVQDLESGTNILDFDEQLDAIREEIERIQNDG